MTPLLTALDAETARLYRLATGPREPVVAIGARQAQRDCGDPLLDHLIRPLQE